MTREAGAASRCSCRCALGHGQTCWCPRRDESRSAGKLLVTIKCEALRQHEQSINHTSPQSTLRRTRHERVPRNGCRDDRHPLRLMLLAPRFGEFCAERACSGTAHLVTNDSRLADCERAAGRSTSSEKIVFWARQTATGRQQTTPGTEPAPSRFVFSVVPVEPARGSQEACVTGPCFPFVLFTGSTGVVNHRRLAQDGRGGRPWSHRRKGPLRALAGKIDGMTSARLRRRHSAHAGGAVLEGRGGADRGLTLRPVDARTRRARHGRDAPNSSRCSRGFAIRASWST